MEKISTTPLAHGSSNNFAGISSTNTTTASNVLNLQLDGLSTALKRNDCSVRAVPSRANFKKSNTCGSLFAKCKCNNHVHHHTTVIPLITEIDCDRENTKLERNSRKTQSFSHPDTPVIFTEENRYPVNCGEFCNRLRTSQETIITTTTGRQKVEIKHSKRASSPNLYANSSSNSAIDIHPEFQVQVTPKSPIPVTSAPPADPDIASSSSPRSIRRPFLKKASKSFPFPQQRSSSFRSFDSVGDRTRSSSSYSVDETSEEIELSGKLQSELLVSETKNSSSSTTTTTVADIHCSENHHYLDNSNNGVIDGSELRVSGGSLKNKKSNEKPITDEKFLQVC